ncbi:ATP-binding protein [Streptomyces radiopugnans]|uniref:ATP-dependent DNA helicase RecG n=1 Tax=Streptomyces radiopugnans TaxID=403935 RepID=A0A1H8ZL12_9ACTN|nr:ATP-binding protein [Streptomyces radiopugnans]SEP65209.1 ATP-dependent DNA helicase RecG [Streptomyces radiopugnans]
MEKRTIPASDALALIEREESHFWDHKSAQSKGTVIQKIAAGLANSDGGEFIVGIEDKGKQAVGLDRWQGYGSIEDATIVLEALARDIEPPVPYSIEYLSIEGREGQGLACLVGIRKSESVHFAADKKVYVRRGAATLSITGQAVTDLSLAKGARTYEDQLLADYDKEDLIVEDELAYFLRSYSPSTPPDIFVRKQRLINRDSGAAKVSAGILYAESPPAVVPKRCAVKIARYNTKNREPRREHLATTPLTIEGPARVVIEETISAVTNLIESVSVLQPSGEMTPVKYPPEVLKEIIVNAVIHRDYNISDDILVYVFDDRVEVRSPGPLPGSMTLDNLLQDRFSRNPTIVRLLNKYPDPPNKDIGEGLRTVVAKMAEAKLQSPVFSIEGNYFVVELGHTPLARPHEIVMEYLDSHEEITNSTGRSLTGISSENSMKDVFYALRKAGKIEMVPGKRGNKSAWRKVPPTETDADTSKADISLAREGVATPPEGDTGQKTLPASDTLKTTKKLKARRVAIGPTRNRPCSCGSGLKYKRCCGQSSA